VSDNGQSARQSFGAELHVALQSLLESIPSHVGLKPQNLPTLDKMNDLTGTGLMTLLLGMNPLGAAPMAFSSSTTPSGGAPSTSEMSGLRSAGRDGMAGLQTSPDPKEDQTGFVTLVAFMQGSSSKNASITKLHSLTGGLNRSLFFTEDSAHKIPTELLKTAYISFLSAIRNRLMVPTKFIESMIVLNELVRFCS
jgi:hypothetical protein